MDKQKVKVLAVSDDYTYRSITVEIDGKPTSFVLGRDTDVADLEKKYVWLSTDANGAFVVEPVEPSKK